MGLNGFIFKKIIKNQTITEKKDPVSRLGFACFIAQPIQPIFIQIGLNWLCYLAGKS
jgi:hypothetical protein